MNVLIKILLRLLYLTPFGYFLTFFKIITPNPEFGVVLNLQKHVPVTVYVKADYTLRDRVNWIINGVALISQGMYVMDKYLQFFGKQYQTYPMTFVWLAVVTGLVNLISGLVPTLDWNKRRIFFLTFAELVIVLSLIVLVLAGDYCIDYEMSSGKFCTEGFLNFIGL